MEIKITKTTERIHRKEITTFFANGIKVATLATYKEYFCTVKNGAPSNLRDKIKTARDTSWNREGLAQLLGHNNFLIGRPTRLFSGLEKPTDPDFIDDYPDLKWGHPGKTLSSKTVKDLIIKCAKKFS